MPRTNGPTRASDGARIYQNVQLTLTLARPLLRQVARQEARYDLKEMVGVVASVQVLEGDPNYSILVSVPEEDVAALKRALDGKCTFSTYTTLSQLGEPSIRRAASR
jgi:hypothetical protein